MTYKKFSGISIITDDENVAAALYLAISHYLAIKAKDKKIVGVPLADELIEALEAVRTGFYVDRTMTQNRSFEINQDLLNKNKIKTKSIRMTLPGKGWTADSIRKLIKDVEENIKNDS